MKKLLLATFIILVSSPLLFAQQTGQQKMHQQMQEMQKMTQKMNDLLERTQRMNQEMNRQMQQLQDEQVKNQYRTMYRFNEQLHMALGNMKNAAERCDLMMQNKEMMRDKEMQQEMERLQKHLGEMSNQAEDAVQTMERLTKRIQQQKTAQLNEND